MSPRAGSASTDTTHNVAESNPRGQMAHMDHPHHQAFIPGLRNATVPLCGEAAMPLRSLPTHPEHTTPGRHPFESMGSSQEPFVLYTLPKTIYLELGFLFHGPKVRCQERNAGNPACMFSLSRTKSKQKGPAALTARMDRLTEPLCTERADKALMFLPPEFLGITQPCSSHAFIDVLLLPWQQSSLISE